MVPRRFFTGLFCLGLLCWAWLAWQVVALGVTAERGVALTFGLWCPLGLVLWVTRCDSETATTLQGVGLISAVIGIATVAFAAF
jgi:hypothetical protein